MALIAAHLGVINQDEILDMSFDWFREVIEVLGEVVNYAAIVNYAGNAFCEKSWDLIIDNNPMLKGQIPTSDQRSWENFFATAEIKVVKRGSANGNENDGSGQGNHGEGQSAV